MKNFLLIDDDEIFNFITIKSLEHLGIAQEVHRALNGRDALNLINDYFIGAASIPDVILVDLNMPVMDGFGFIEAFKRLNQPRLDQVKIIVVSSSQDPLDIMRIAALGIKHYVCKPVSEEKLLSVIEAN
jgi:CheY-like chemotaxis protein